MQIVNDLVAKINEKHGPALVQNKVTMEVVPQGRDFNIVISGPLKNVQTIQEVRDKLKHMYQNNIRLDYPLFTFDKMRRKGKNQRHASDTVSVSSFIPDEDEEGTEE